MSYRTNRRRFLKSALVPAAGWMILGQSRSARSYEANEQLNIAAVGVGKPGRYHPGQRKTDKKGTWIR